MAPSVPGLSMASSYRSSRTSVRRSGRLIALLALMMLLGWLYWLQSAPPPVRPASHATRVVAVEPAQSEVSAVAAEVRSHPDVHERLSTGVSPLQAASDQLRRVVHGMPQPGACLAGTGAGTTSGKMALHRWVDAEGIIHFSDKAPVGANTGHRRIEVGGLPGVQVSARGHDINLPEHFQQHAVADAQAIERVFESELGISRAGGIALQVVYVASAEHYEKLLGDPALASSSGAYSGRERTIYVRAQPTPAANSAILRHEMSHALVHERIGNLPVAINEGLAGFFERLQPAAMGAQISFAPDRAALISAQPGDQAEDALVDLLAREGSQFYADKRETRYLHAYALVALLMGDGAGRAALARVLAAQQASPCEPANVAEILDQQYPQGLRGLARQWARWLADPPNAVLAF